MEAIYPENAPDCLKSMDSRGLFLYTKLRKGGARVEWKLDLDPSAQGVTVTVTAPEENDEVRALLALLSPLSPIPGWQGDRAVPLEPDRVLCFYAQDKEVYALTPEGEFLVKLRLYELEERLASRPFARTSNSELVNLKAVTALDLTFSGTIRLTLRGGHVCWVSRRNVKNIKKALGL